MLRILIVDDSPTARQLLTAILGSDPGIQVVGVAKNGQEAVDMTRQLRPDLVTMDIRMPGMDGFEATKEIMVNTPTPIVLVSASTSVHEVDMGMQALRAGALTLLLKPPGPESPGFEKAAKELIATVKAMSDVKVVRHHRRPAAPPMAGPRPMQRKPSQVRVVAIATSTGGPPALQRLFSGLPSDFPTPILVVQHIADGFTEGLVSWLDGVVPLKVKVAQTGESLVPGTVYIAPEDWHLGASQQRTVVLSAEPALGGFRPSATFLFQSVASSFGDSAVAIMLTGMGDDGVDGLRQIRLAGGRIIAQDESSCVVFGMPGASVAAGLVDMLRPLDDISGVLMDLTRRHPG